MILVDLQKVFDTLDQTALSQKVECIGIKKSVIKRFQLYLSNRKFFMTLENVFSDAGLIGLTGLIGLIGLTVVFQKDLS